MSTHPIGRAPVAALLLATASPAMTLWEQDGVSLECKLPQGKAGPASSWRLILCQSGEGGSGAKTATRTGLVRSSAPRPWIISYRQTPASSSASCLARAVDTQ